MEERVKKLEENLKKGDVILFHNNTIVNWAVRVITQSYWGHAAMYIGDGLYIESIATGVYIHDISTLENADIKIYRHKQITPEVANKIIHAARLESKKGYDFLAIWHLLKLIITGKRYNNEGSIGVKDKFICSELIALAYNEVGLKIMDELEYDEVIPADFDLSPNFDKINF